MKKEKNKKLFDSTVIKFIFVGIINTVVGWIAMFITMHLMDIAEINHTINYWTSSAVNIIVGSIVSYILNKNFTFNSNTESKKDIIKFIINILVCYIVAYGIAKPIAKFIFSSASSLVLQIVSLLSGSILFTVLNYFGQRFYVFKEEEK
ncbi:GtrA family protein [Ligilactobacillus cholophilus]|uniref:GtrA family protein n=1 Tax=Ligilactobacillus cholophilus TaxID=3050131 RepID=UPI0025B0478A|nr:GtrA family protein [Ligilactobacillus cholophilus]